MKHVPIPQRMRHLERDRRGYLIPVTVLRDRTGKPHFTINEESVRQRILADDRCPICGGKLTRGRWFVGGPQSAFHPRGAYIDPPMHNECAHYALQVCPYIAAPNYARRIDANTLPPGERRILIDNTTIPARPDYFVAVMTTGQINMKVSGTDFVQYIQPRRPYSRIEFWRHGQHVGEQEIA